MHQGPQLSPTHLRTVAGNRHSEISVEHVRTCSIVVRDDEVRKWAVGGRHRFRPHRFTDIGDPELAK